MLRRLLFGPPKPTDEDRSQPHINNNEANETSPLLRQEQAPAPSTPTNTTTYTVVQSPAPPPRPRRKRGNCCRSCCTFCLLNFLLLVVIFQLLSWAIPSACEVSTERLPFCPTREPELPKVPKGTEHHNIVYKFDMDVPLLDRPPDIEVLEAMDINDFPAGLKGSVVFKEGDLYQPKSLMIYVRISGMEWGYERAVTVAKTTWPEFPRKDLVKITSRGPHTPKNPLNVEVFGFIRPDIRSWGNIVINSTNLDIEFEERKPHSEANNKVVLQTVKGNIRGMLQKNLVYSLHTLEMHVKSVQGKITGTWGTHKNSTFTAKEVDVSFLISGDQPPFTNRNVNIHAAEDVTVKMEFNQTLSTALLTNQTMIIESLWGNIAAAAIHGGFTNLTAPAGHIVATLLPYWTGGHDVFSAEHHPKLESFSAGKTKITVLHPLINADFPTNPLNETISRHEAGGSLYLRYPQEWGGHVDVTGGDGIAEVDGNGLDIERVCSRFVEARRPGGSEMDAIGGEGATVIFDDVDSLEAEDVSDAVNLASFRPSF